MSVFRNAEARELLSLDLENKFLGEDWFFSVWWKIKL